MKLDVTPAQLEAIKQMASNVEATLGCLGDDGENEFDIQAIKQLRLIDRMLEKNNTPR